MLDSEAPSHFEVEELTQAAPTGRSWPSDRRFDFRKVMSAFRLEKAQSGLLLLSY